MGEETNSRELWNEAYRQDPDQSVPADELLDPEIARLTAGAALDLGCGSGRNSRKLSRLGWAVTGVDWSDAAIAIAREAAQAEGVDVRLVVADITQWQPPQLYNLVLSVFALPGGENNALALRTAAAALAPGGTLLVFDWDAAMAEVWGLDDELLTPAQIAALLPGLRIDAAEVRPLLVAGETASVAFVRAVRTG